MNPAPSPQPPAPVPRCEVYNDARANRPTTGGPSMPDAESVIREIAFEMAASSVRFGAGVTREVGMDLVDLGVRRALVVTDPSVARLAPVATVLAALDEAGVQAVLYDKVRVEPTDVSFRDAIEFARTAAVDGIVAVGGGSVIDTAKAVNLYRSE